MLLRREGANSNTPSSWSGNMLIDCPCAQRHRDIVAQAGNRCVAQSSRIVLWFGKALKIGERYFARKHGLEIIAGITRLH